MSHRQGDDVWGMFGPETNPALPSLPLQLLPSGPRHGLSQTH